MPMSSILNVMSTNTKCKECGISKWSTDHDVHLHVEIEHLKQRLAEKDDHIVTMETAFINEANKFPNGEFIALKDELHTWQDKYKRLYEAHRRVQRVNQGLEDKLLRLVDVCESEKNALTKDVATLSHRLAEANYTIKKLTDENERYKNDVSIAIQLLQCKPSNFIPQKFESLPNEMQEKVSSYVANKRKITEDKKLPTEVRSIKVPIPTFPPTAMVYSINKSPSPEKSVNILTELEKPQVDIVSAAIMAKVLEERQRERSCTKHCDTCTCSKNKTPRLIQPNITYHSISTQTLTPAVDFNKYSPLCVKCKIPPEANKKVPTYTNDRLSGGITNNINNSQSVLYFNVNEKVENKNKHHRLCEKASQSYKIDEKCDEEKPILLSAEDQSSDSTKGPRFCSVRVQNGSNNILLDNVQDTFAPVLYTRIQNQTSSEIKQLDSSITESCSSEDRRPISLLGSQTSLHNQQRVAEWIEKSAEERDAISSDNSRTESINSKSVSAEALRYAEMESNVKKFLFAGCERTTSKVQVKTVAGEKYKYQSLRDSDNNSVTRSSSNKSHTETEI